MPYASSTKRPAKRMKEPSIGLKCSVIFPLMLLRRPTHSRVTISIWHLATQKMTETQTMKPGFTVEFSLLTMKSGESKSPISRPAGPPTRREAPIATKSAAPTVPACLVSVCESKSAKRTSNGQQLNHATSQTTVVRHSFHRVSIVFQYDHIS